MDKSVCPFCKKPIRCKFFWKSGTWSCGCYNKECLIRPKTQCVLSENLAKEEWYCAFKS